MDAASFSFSVEKGWSVNEFPRLDSPQTAIIVFAASEFFDNSDALKELKSHYPTSHMVGCSTSGEIHGCSLADQSLSVAILKFNKSKVRSIIKQVPTGDDSYKAAAAIAAELDADDLKAVFVLSDGLNVNGSELARGLNDSLRPEVVVTGGLAGDGSRFEETFVIHEGDVHLKSITAIGLYGENVVVGHGSKGGWDKFGHERLITKSKGNVLYELDGKPALDIYKEYLGDKASELPASALLFPLSVRESPYSDKSLVRSILGVDHEANTMTFAGDLTEGSLAQFLFANMDRVIDGAFDAADRAMTNGDGDIVTISISCLGRRLILCDRTEEEIEAIRDALAPNSHLIGFYSYGELSPFEDGAAYLHNQSMTITTYREAA